MVAGRPPLAPKLSQTGVVRTFKSVTSERIVAITAKSYFPPVAKRIRRRFVRL